MARDKDFFDFAGQLSDLLFQGQEEVHFKPKELANRIEALLRATCFLMDVPGSKTEDTIQGCVRLMGESRRGGEG